MYFPSARRLQHSGAPILRAQLAERIGTKRNQKRRRKTTGRLFSLHMLVMTVVKRYAKTSNQLLRHSEGNNALALMMSCRKIVCIILLPQRNLTKNKSRKVLTKNVAETGGAWQYVVRHQDWFPDRVEAPMRTFHLAARGLTQSRRIAIKWDPHCCRIRISGIVALHRRITLQVPRTSTCRRIAIDGDQTTLRAHSTARRR